MNYDSLINEPIKTYNIFYQQLQKFSPKILKLSNKNLEDIIRPGKVYNKKSNLSFSTSSLYNMMIDYGKSGNITSYPTFQINNKNIQKPNELCNCGSQKKYKKCCKF